MADKQRRTLAVLVDNEAGVLSQVTRLFSRKGYNIESLAVGATDNPAVSRITIEVDADDDEINLLCNQLNKLFNPRSGLLGVSGISSDMKTLLEQRDEDPMAAQAVDMYAYHARKAIGALSTVLGGLDMLVFTGGIGERAAIVRELICQGMDHLGIRLDPERNVRHAPVISKEGMPVAVRVIPTNEDLMIVRHTRRLLFGEKA